jgi:hypothetical protein
MTTKCFHCGCGHESKKCPHQTVYVRIGERYRFRGSDNVYTVTAHGESGVWLQCEATDALISHAHFAEHYEQVDTMLAASKPGFVADIGAPVLRGTRWRQRCHDNYVWIVDTVDSLVRFAVTPDAGACILNMNRNAFHAAYAFDPEPTAAAPSSRAPQVGDVWRLKVDRRFAFRIDFIDTVARGKWTDDSSGNTGLQTVAFGMLDASYAFDAEATAKAKAEMAAVNCQAAVDVVLGAALCGPPRAELPENVAAFGTEATKVEYYAAPPAPSPRCPRCAGPAYAGLGVYNTLTGSTGFECLRPGGCRTAAERVAEEEARVGPCVIARVGQRGTFAGEPYWQALVDGVSSYHPTREGAVLAWRAAAIAAERGR